MVWISGGSFLMGSDRHYPEEAPAHEVSVNGFWMDRHTVTNREFKRFVDATGHVTLAERPANAADYPGAKPESLRPSSVLFKKASGPVDLRTLQLVGIRRGRELAPSAGPGKLASPSLGPPGGARRLRRRRSLCQVGRKGIADGSRMGIRGTRRVGRRRVLLG
jgi:hypothetical protein